MLLLPYDALNFPSSAPSALHGPGNLGVSWRDLVWAAITVGKPGASHLFMHGWHSISDLLVRTHTVFASLRATGSWLARSTLYDSADPTEKGATSYFLGMAVAKLACSRLLGTPFLFHFSMTGPMGLPIRVRSSLEPDLLGLLPDGRWIVVEAKGRTNGRDPVALTKAKRQTRAVRSVDGSGPAMRIAAQTYFDPKMRLVLDDPESEDDDSVDVEVNLEATYRRYYSFAYAATHGSNDIRKLKGRSYVFRTIPEAGVQIGISQDVRSLLEQSSILPVELARRLVDTQSPAESDAASTYPDGLAIALNEKWDPELMTREPTDRTGR